MAQPETRFVVSRLRWHRGFWGDYQRSPGEVALASFSTFEEAEANRTARELRARSWVNPFTCGSAVHHWTHLDEPRLRDWLLDRGIEPPAVKGDGATDWAGWWTGEHKKLSNEKCAAVWDALDKVRFYSVAECPMRSVVYAVVRVDWEYNDQCYVTYNDGGEVQILYRRRVRAEEECTRLNAAARANWDRVEIFDIQYRLRAQHDLFANPPDDQGYREQRLPLNEVPFYEVIELELEEGHGPCA